MKEKDVLMSLAFTEEITAGGCGIKRGNNGDAKLTVEEAVLKVRGANKIRELYQILREIPEAGKMKGLRIRKDVGKNVVNGECFKR